MNRRVLLVDDDSNILQGYRRSLRGKFDVHVALGSEIALEMIHLEAEPFAAIVSDMRMPGMDGIEFLKRVTELSPNTVRIMLSGHADQQAVIDSVNEGQVFRFLSKPCEQQTLAQTLELALSHYQLIVSEQELLSQTLTGSMHVLTDILSMVNPAAFGRASRVRRLASDVAKRMKVRNAWECEIASMLAMIGTIAVPESVMQKVENGAELEFDELEILKKHPLIGESLVAHIPRLRNTAKCIKYQSKNYDGSGFPEDDLAGDDIPIGARILRVVLAYDAMLEKGEKPERAFAVIQDDEKSFDLQVVSALEECIELHNRYEIIEVNIRSLPDHCILAQDVLTNDGMLLIHGGQELTDSMRMRLVHHSRTVGIQEPVKVMVAAETPPLSV